MLGPSAKRLERQFERAHRHNFGLTSFFDARISERPHIGRNFVFEENLNLLNARLVNPHARAETIHNLLVQPLFRDPRPRPKEQDPVQLRHQPERADVRSIKLSAVFADQFLLNQLERTRRPNTRRIPAGFFALFHAAPA